MFLLIDKGANTLLLPYAERYVLFTGYEACFEEAKRRGYGSGGWADMHKGPSEPGVMCSYMAGDIDISFMQVELR